MAVVRGMFTFVFIVELILGNVGNGFIALVNCLDWVKRRKISSVDHILTALAISRIGLLWSVVLSVFIFVLYPARGTAGYKQGIIFIIWIVTNHFSIWLATILSLYYFLKIASFPNSIFLYLKGRVKSIVSGTLLLSIVILCLNFVLINATLDESKRNTSYEYTSRNVTAFLVTFTVYLSMPYIVSLVMFLLLIFSLWKHHQTMYHHGYGDRDVSTVAHIRALQMVVAFLLLYSIFILTLVVQYWSIDPLKTYWHILFCQAVGMVFPSGHSWVLVLGNSKLRRASQLVLRQLQCSLRPRPKELEPPRS
ncbi:taste receptor type 2 member 125-like [Perognathus longimembris pacificus]|uniref:taste receptor type 2 member 125-like n=1 Tax=Perognathus longimembris pacificus TaxID=214514 RepID=UPI002019EB9C|nr:taste receptor type 2 member 125-like [Perognathus longimembris pacificus]